MVEAVKHSPKVSIILLNWNGAEFTIPCVESLRLQSYDNIEIIVVDNGSVDGSRSLLEKKFGGAIKLLPLEKNRGFTGGNNAGIELALQDGADYVLVLNNDTVAERNFVKELVALAETSGNIGVVTGKIFYHDQKELLWFAGGIVQRGLLAFKHRGLLKRDTGEYDTVGESRFVTGCCMLVRREVFETVGLFDDRFFIYSEDADFSLRAFGKGYRLMYTPHAVLWHKESASMRKNTLAANTGTVSPRQYYLSTRNYIYVVRKYCTSLEIFISISYLVMRSVLWSFFFIIRGRWEKLSSLWKGIIDGVSDHVRSEK
jgi:GT2 family glycosyltransferase